MSNEYSIRKELLTNYFVRAINNSGINVVNEFNVVKYRGGSRIDIAIIGNYLHGIEIKSSKDNLKRLPNQIKSYKKVFGRLTVVVSPNHYGDVCNIVPLSCGIILAIDITKKSILLKRVRKTRIDYSGIDSLSLLNLLWKVEAYELLKKHFPNTQLNKRTYLHVILKELIEGLSIKVIMKEVTLALKKRRLWTIRIKNKKDLKLYLQSRCKR